MEDGELFALFGPLHADLLMDDRWDRRWPKLAHYTSIEALEKILQSDEIWFSHPLFMNDLQEVRLGFLKAW